MRASLAGWEARRREVYLLCEIEAPLPAAGV